MFEKAILYLDHSIRDAENTAKMLSKPENIAKYEAKAKECRAAILALARYEKMERVIIDAAKGHEHREPKCLCGICQTSRALATPVSEAEEGR